MYLQGYGYGADDMSEWKGSDAANVALQRFANLIDTVNAIRAAAAGNANVLVLVDHFENRLKSWATSNQTPIWKEVAFHLAPLTYVGVGIAKLLGWYKTDAEKYGVEYLNKVKAFETEIYGAGGLCSQVQAAGVSVLACSTTPPAPVPIQPDPTLLETVTRPFVTLLKWSLVGVGVYFGAQLLRDWLSQKGGSRA